MYTNCHELRNILCDISNVHLTSLGLVEEECFSNVCCSVGHKHDICQNIYTSRLWTNYVLPEKHNSQHITFWDKTVLSLEDFGWIVEHM